MMWFYIALGIFYNAFAVIDSIHLISADGVFIANETITTVNGTNSRTNETTLADFTYTFKNITNSSTVNHADDVTSIQVDCLGLGTTVAKALKLFFISASDGKNALNVKFTLSSRRQPYRVKVLLGDQFGLEWTDFNIERRTVVIVHGFLSHGEEQWIADMEKAFLRWRDVNVLIVDWSDGGNTWNYYKAAVNTEVVGKQISRLLDLIKNTTIIDHPDVEKWGPLHLIGHSLGAHICGFAAKEFKKRQNHWRIQRITGLDPAQPCFKNPNPSMHLHKSDATFVDIIHTNGRLLTNIGLGLPESLGDADFYPNGGKVQPGCARTNTSYFDYLPIPKTLIQKTICSHGRSYLYFTESLKSDIAGNCSFWARHWDLTFRHVNEIVSHPCSRENCTEMGIRAELYPQRGTFFVATTDSPPFCANSTEISKEVKQQLEADHADDMED